jgi:hypothetical protein
MTTEHTPERTPPVEEHPDHRAESSAHLVHDLEAAQRDLAARRRALTERDPA